MSRIITSEVTQISQESRVSILQSLSDSLTREGSLSDLRNDKENIIACNIDMHLNSHYHENQTLTNLKREIAQETFHVNMKYLQAEFDNRARMLEIDHEFRQFIAAKTSCLENVKTVCDKGSQCRYWSDVYNARLENNLMRWNDYIARASGSCRIAHMRECDEEPIEHQLRERIDSMESVVVETSQTCESLEHRCLELTTELVKVRSKLYTEKESVRQLTRQLATVSSNAELRSELDTSRRMIDLQLAEIGKQEELYLNEICTMRINYEEESHKFEKQMEKHLCQEIEFMKKSMWDTLAQLELKLNNRQSLEKRAERIESSLNALLRN